MYWQRILRGVVLLACAVMLLGMGQAAEADFVVHLRNGKEFVVDRYQESGDQIRYSRFGGKVGIPKNRVAVIENRETGEKRVYNQPYTAQQKEALRERALHEQALRELRLREQADR